MLSVVVFAAGRGSRLGFSIPKSLIEIDGRALFSYQLDALAPLAAEVYVVCGYRAELLVNVMLDHVKCSAANVRRLSFVYNPDYQQSQHGSVLRALDAIPLDRPALFVDGDVLFQSETAVTMVGGNSTTALVRSEASADGVMAQTRGNRLVSFCRNGSGNLEWGNLICYRAESLRLLRRLARDAAGGHHFELINRLVVAGEVVELHLARVAEIDTAEDVPAAAAFLRNAGLCRA